MMPVAYKTSYEVECGFRQVDPYFWCDDPPLHSIQVSVRSVPEYERSLTVEHIEALRGMFGKPRSEVEAAIDRMLDGTFVTAEAT